MSEEKIGQNIDFSVSKDNLFREETITDLKVASIRQLIPIKPDGTRDESRTPLFFGHSQLVSPQGPVPLRAPLAANNIQDAIEVFPQAMREDLDAMVKKIQDMQKKEEEKKKQSS